MTPADGATIAIPLDEQGRIGIDLPCCQCDYNLRGLTADGECPECGTRVAYVTGGYYLQHAAPEWVRRMARGALWLIITVIAVVLGALVIGLVAVVQLISGGMPGGPTSPNFAQNLQESMMIPGIVVGGIGVVLQLIGFVLITTREPEDWATDEPLNARRMIRYALFLLPIPTLMSILTSLARAEFTLESTQVAAVVLPAMLGLLLHMILSVLLMRHLMVLMPRAHRPGLARYAKIMFWGLLIAGSLSFVGQTTNLIYGAKFMAATPTTFAPISPTAATGAAPASQPGTTTSSIVAAPPRFGPPGMVVSPAQMLLQSLGGCADGGFHVAAFVLLVLAQRALSASARQSEARAGTAAVAAPPG